jgi:F-type H+-transporting ATPase subunit alpha
MTELLKQPQYQPMPTEEQVASLFAAARGHLDDIPVDRVLAFESGLLEFLRSAKTDVLADIRERQKLDDDLEGRLAAAVGEFKASFPVRG